MPGERKLLDDRYELRRLLGTGPVGQMWEGYDHTGRARVAVKLFHAHLAQDPAFRASARQAAQDAARVRHGSVVAVRDPGDGSFVVMDHVVGASVRALLDSEGRLPADRAVELLFDACTALAAAHEQGVLHRNLKPENLLVVSGSLNVTDFGLAARADGAGLITSARYLAPEVTLSGRGDTRSDVYALGCCLYEMVTGRPPFDGPTPFAVAAKHASEEPAPPSAAGATVSPELEAVIMRALAKDPDARYQTAMDLRGALQRLALERGRSHRSRSMDTLGATMDALGAPDHQPGGSVEPSGPPAWSQPGFEVESPSKTRPRGNQDDVPAETWPPAEAPAFAAGSEPFEAMWSAATPVASERPAPAPVSPLSLMEADADLAGGDAPQPTGRGGGGSDWERVPSPAAAAPRPRQRAASARESAPRGGVQVVAAVLVVGILAGVITGLVALLGPTEPAAAQREPATTAPPASTAPPTTVPPTTAPPTTQPGPANVDELIAVIDADPKGAGPRGKTFKGRLSKLDSLSGQARVTELTDLLGIARAGAANGDFTPEFSKVAARVLQAELQRRPSA